MNKPQVGYPLMGRQRMKVFAALAALAAKCMFWLLVVYLIGAVLWGLAVRADARGHEQRPGNVRELYAPSTPTPAVGDGCRPVTVADVLLHPCNESSDLHSLLQDDPAPAVRPLVYPGPENLFLLRVQGLSHP